MPRASVDALGAVVGRRADVHAGVVTDPDRVGRADLEGDGRDEEIVLRAAERISRVPGFLGGAAHLKGRQMVIVCTCAGPELVPMSGMSEYAPSAGLHRASRCRRS
jgi:hypothetical protein